MLLLSWRLPSHPRAGGAEHLTQRVAEGLASRGHRVRWVGSGTGDTESLGVSYSSIGSSLSCIARAPNYFRKLTPKPDAVVEQINTLPFFASRYVDVPLLTWFQQLARDVWWYEAPFPANALGFALEPMYLRAYRCADVITISNSSAADLRRHRVGKRTSVIPIAVDMPARESPAPVPPDPLRLLFIGRLVPSKRPQDAIRALARVRVARAATLAVVGRGPERFVRWLRDLINQMRLGDYVNFLGYVSDEEKMRLLDSSHVLLVPSAKEGWGLVVTEANRRGVPAIAYDVDGLRDAIEDGSTGWLCDASPALLAAVVLRATSDAAKFGVVRANALNSARAFSWDRTVIAFEAILRRAVQDRRS